MNPIQQHEQDLLKILSQAGFTLQRDVSSTHAWRATSPDAEVELWDGVSPDNATRVEALSKDDVMMAAAEHGDPRVALRMCLIMAGLIVECPPMVNALIDESERSV